MEYIYAVLLLHSAKKDISEGNIKKILEAAGIAVDDIRLKAL
ncbi:MAG: 50S ribosomal protein P1, partial [Ignisphaera sp.]